MVEETNKEDSGLTKLEEARRVVERMEKANADFQELLKKAEEMRVSDMLSGESFAGKKQEKPVEESPEDYAKRVMNGGL
jgi:hypothetical protein